MELVRRIVAASGKDVEPDVQGEGTPHGGMARQYLDSRATKKEPAGHRRGGLNGGLAEPNGWSERHLSWARARARAAWWAPTSPPQTERIAPSAPTGSRRWSSRLPHTTRSKVPTTSGERSYTLVTTRSTRAPSASRAISKPLPLGPASCAR